MRTWRPCKERAHAQKGGSGCGACAVRRKRRDGGGAGGDGAVLPQRAGAVRALRGRQPDLVAAGLPQPPPRHLPVRLGAPHRQEDPQRLRRALRRLREVPAGERGRRGQVQRARRRLPALRRAGEGGCVRGSSELRFILRSE